VGIAHRHAEVGDAHPTKLKERHMKIAFAAILACLCSCSREGQFAAIEFDPTRSIREEPIDHFNLAVGETEIVQSNPEYNLTLSGIDLHRSTCTISCASRLGDRAGTQVLHEGDIVQGLSAKREAPIISVSSIHDGQVLFRIRVPES
jgi:hypothetical protein